MRRFVILLAAAALLTGCAGYNEIRVEGVALGGLRFNGTSSATIELKATVDNPTKYTIAIEEVDAVLMRTGKEFARFSLEDKPAAAPGKKEVVEIPVKASVLDPVAIITSGLNFRSWAIEDFTVEGKIVLSADGGKKRTLHLKKVPLESIVERIK